MKTLKRLAVDAITFAKRVLALEPIVCVGVLTSVVVWLAGHFGIVLPHASVEAVVVPLISAVIGRRLVVPHAKAPKDS